VAVFAALALTHANLEAIEIEVLDAEFETLGEAQAGAVQQGGHQVRGAGQAFEDTADFVARQHHWQPGHRGE
jgi:hypothetical protein